ncbi:uncharacterized protein EI90DRAFT_3131939 [Cantharellus anzutake]|uniref:uncharacterized protein n=1 Tax=Cantharellus anzutake TaxID=1750568 RepID=UPI00190694AA|nr:uncharacterized protein EI90DRAFT_3131939 [Cantharellus anzutake]KAF8320565.1 hypothetical protein EI90DRAFT_3131939 [Cantharellus anzutake]
MLRMFRLIFILALFFAKNFANPIDPALPVPDRRDTSPAHGPFGTLKGLPLLTAEPSSTHDGAGSGGLGAAASCPGYHTVRSVLTVMEDTAFPPEPLLAELAITAARDSAVIRILRASRKVRPLAAAAIISAGLEADAVITGNHAAIEDTLDGWCSKSTNRPAMWF